MSEDKCHGITAQPNGKMEKVEELQLFFSLSALLFASSLTTTTTPHTPPAASPARHFLLLLLLVVSVFGVQHKLKEVQ